MFLENMCKEAGKPGIGKKSINSLHGTSATAFLNAGVPKKLICDVTAHRCNALNLYECPSVKQKQSVSPVRMQGQKSFERESVRGSLCNSLPHNSLLLWVPMCVVHSSLASANVRSVNLSPQNFIANFGIYVSSSSDSHDVDQIFYGIALEQFSEQLYIVLVTFFTLFTLVAFHKYV